MKKNVVGKVIAKAAYKSAEKKANEICAAIFYQPQLPKSVKNLKKI